MNLSTCDWNMSSDAYPIAAIRFRKGEAIDPLLANVVAALQRKGLRLGGVLQEERRDSDGCCAGTWLCDIADGSLVQISQDLGRLAQGCRLDRTALAEVAARL